MPYRPQAPQQLPLSHTTTRATHLFRCGRYEAKKFLEQQGKKQVYVAHHSSLDREVAFALIKTECLNHTLGYKQNCDKSD